MNSIQRKLLMLSNIFKLIVIYDKQIRKFELTFTFIPKSKQCTDISYKIRGRSQPN